MCTFALGHCTSDSAETKLKQKSMIVTNNRMKEEEGHVNATKACVAMVTWWIHSSGVKNKVEGHFKKFTQNSS